MTLIRRLDDLVDPTSLPAVPRPDRILMAEPEFFDVEYVINPHMAGNVGQVDRLLARQQWRALRETYRRLGQHVDVLPGEPFLPDYVFTANQALPVPPGFLSERPGAILSIMRSARRQAEIRPYAAGLDALGVQLEQLDPYEVRNVEGTGDGSWYPGRALLLAGVGPRSDETAWVRVSAFTGVPIVVLQLVDPRFYHLDTCLAPIDERCALYYPGAFTAEGCALIEALYPEAIAVGEAEAVNMVCNGHSPDGKNFIVEPGAPSATLALRERGVAVHEVETSEFRKSGGSVFCMKLHFWGP